MMSSINTKRDNLNGYLFQDGSRQPYQDLSYNCANIGYVTYIYASQFEFLILINYHTKTI